MEEAELETIRAFANTLDEEEETDALATPEGLVAWLAEAGLADGVDRVTRAVRERTVVLRDAIRGLLEHHNGAPLDPGIVAALDAQAARSRVVLGFAADPLARTLVPRAQGLDGALGLIVVLVGDGIADGSLRRLKLCRAVDCRWAFLDGSRNGSRHWCSMEVCGNREKARAFRARRR